MKQVTLKLKSLFGNKAGRIIYRIVIIAIAACILCWQAVYNGYPLIFNSDTAMYMEAANNGIVAVDRPILYGLFMLNMGFHYSTWFVVATQALILALVIWLYFEYLLTETNKATLNKKAIFYIVFVITVSFFMGASFDVSRLMADVFTSVSILGIGLLFFARNMGLMSRILVSLMVVLSTGMHNTHIYICGAVIVIFLIISVFKGFRMRLYRAGLTIKKISFALALIILSNLLVSTIHYSYGGGGKSSGSGAVFLMANLVEMGIVDDYLSEVCDKKDYKLCRFRGSLPNNFLWNDRSPMYKTGGWEANEAEYTGIVKDILTTPRFAAVVVFKSVVYTFKQFFYFNVGEAYKPWDRVDRAIYTYYPGDYIQYSLSKQNKETLDFTVLNYVQTLIFCLCFLVYMLVLLTARLIDTKYKVFLIFVLLAMIINAWLCGTVSGVYLRYQSRVMWMLPLPIFLYFLENPVQIKYILKLRNKT